MPGPLDAVLETLARAPAFVFLLLLWSALFFALSLPGSALARALTRRFKLSWVKAALAATYIETAGLVLIAYFGLYFLPIGSIQTGPFPADLRFDAFNEFTLNATALLAVLARNLVVAGVLALLAFPFIILSAFVQDFFSAKPRRWNALLARAAGAITTTLAVLTVLAWFPWVGTALIYLFFFAG